MIGFCHFFCLFLFLIILCTKNYLASHNINLCYEIVVAYIYKILIIVVYSRGPN